MRLRKKLAFLGLFSLSLITMAIAIARVADISATTLGSGTSGFGFNPKFLWLWTAVEPCVGESASMDAPWVVLLTGVFWCPPPHPRDMQLIDLANGSNHGRVPVSISSALLALGQKETHTRLSAIKHVL